MIVPHVSKLSLISTRIIGTLCNACGVKWSLKFRKRERVPRKNNSKDDDEKENHSKKKNGTKKTPTTPNGHKKSPKPSNSNNNNNNNSRSSNYKSMSNDSSEEEDQHHGGQIRDGKEYYCKYCGLTWPLNYFKNTQQFGAHCSNCSRKQRGGNEILFYPSLSMYTLDAYIAGH